MVLLVSIVLVCLGGHLAQGQQCGAALEGFRACIKQNHQGEEAEAVNFPGGSVSQSIRSCFTQSGCGQPKLIGEETAGNEAMMGALIKCSDEVKDTIKTMMAQCMEQTPNIGPGFKVHNDMIAPLPLAVPNPPPPPPPLVIVSSTAYIYDDVVCPTANNKATARQCVAGVAKTFIPFDAAKASKHPIETNMELAKLCWAKDLCKKQMPEKCQGDLDNIRSYLCNCAKHTFSHQSHLQPLIDTFKTCVGREAGQAAVQNQAVTTFTTYAQRLLTNLMCMPAPDPCKPAEFPQPGQGGPQGGQQGGQQGQGQGGQPGQFGPGAGQQPQAQSQGGFFPQ